METGIGRSGGACSSPLVRSAKRSLEEPGQALFLPAPCPVWPLYSTCGQEGIAECAPFLSN